MKSDTDTQVLSTDKVATSKATKKEKQKSKKSSEKTSADKLVSYQISRKDFQALQQSKAPESPQIETKSDIQTPPKAARRSRSSSVRKSRPGSLIESSSTASIASEAESPVSGRNSSLDGRASSASVSSPPAGRARPPVLRNFQLSTFTGQIQEQKAKYLPPPRIRKSSDEPKPQVPLRSKSRKSNEEKRKSMELKRRSMEEQKIMEEDKNKVSFEFKFVGSKTSVQVVGNFNNWIPEDLYLNNNGVWSKHVQLSNGIYFFR